MSLAKSPVLTSQASLTEVLALLAEAAGEHKLELLGPAGNIEAILTLPAEKTTTSFALLGHPHSLQGGTMNNKVVTTMVRAFRDLGIPSLRFNFRGVGESEGVFDHGIGEATDFIALAKQIQAYDSKLNFIFAGFSFGSYVAYRAAAQVPHQLLITIAPPVVNFDYQAFTPPPQPWAILQGGADEVTPVQDLREFVAQSGYSLDLRFSPEIGHFFHGQLLLLKDSLIKIITNLAP